WGLCRPASRGRSWSASFLCLHARRARVSTAGTQNAAPPRLEPGGRGIHSGTGGGTEGLPGSRSALGALLRGPLLRRGGLRHGALRGGDGGRRAVRPVRQGQLLGGED